MTTRSDFVTIEVNEQRLDVWAEYRVASDMLTPADSFELIFSPGIGHGDRAKESFARVRDICVKGAEVTLYVGADVTGQPRRIALQLTGRIDDRIIDISRERGAVLHVTGRDRAAYLVDSSTPMGLLRTLASDSTFIDLARVAVAPWGISVISDQSAARNVLTGATGFSDAQRLEVEQAVAQGISRRLITQQIVRRAAADRIPVDEAVGAAPSDRARARSSSGLTPSDVERQRVTEAQPHPGESVWSYLERHAERLGIMMWMSPRGDLILGNPNYSATPLYRFVQRCTNDPNDPNNYVSGRHHESIANRYSKVTVYGRAHGNDITRSRIRAVAKDDSLPFVRQKIEHRPDCTTQALADRAAKRIIRESVAADDQIDISADDHGQGHYLYAINTTAEYVNEYDDVADRRFLVSRTFQRSRSAGTSTEIRMIPLNSLTL